jgi:hypothetical protein
MNRERASFQFQAPDGYRVGDPHPARLPFNPGARVRVGSLEGVFEVVSFDGALYRLRADSGAELRAGRKAVRSYNEVDHAGE